MFGAFIGDIVGSKYEFNNIKTKDFPLFSNGCDYTDDSIMTAAVAKAILKSRSGQYEADGKGRGFAGILIETMQEYGRRFPDPTGAYGSHFAQWLRMRDPKPYNSFGNGSAMRVSPCGLAATDISEALALARISASVSHDHPEGIKGAEAVAAAVFLAKSCHSKEEIASFITENYYSLDFTLDRIRPTYSFDSSCQGSVPQAIKAFLESESFEDAIRNAVSIGGDSDTIAAITGSIAWMYYAVQSGGCSGWTVDKIDPDMLKLKEKAKAYLPEDFVTLEEQFREVCWRRAGAFFRMGFCTPVMSREERIAFDKEWAPKVSGGRAYSLDYVKGYAHKIMRDGPGGRTSSFDTIAGKWRMRIRLDDRSMWFLSVFLNADGSFDKFCLDNEAASDSHYEFRNERGVRAAIYAPGDEKLYFAEALIRFVSQNGGDALLGKIYPFVTAQFHFD